MRGRVSSVVHWWCCGLSASGGTWLAVPFLVTGSLNLQGFIFLMCLNPLQSFSDPQDLASVVVGAPSVAPLSCGGCSILWTLLWGFEDLRERSDWLYVCPRTVLSMLFSESFFSGNWYLETTICMFGAFIITAFSLFLRCFQWTELGNTFFFFRKRNKILD